MIRALTLALLAASTMLGAALWPPTIEAQGVVKGHILLTPASVKWSAGPPSLPPGAQAAALEGDPAKPGSFIETIVQLHGTGPWAITYVNAADDPRKK